MAVIHWSGAIVGLTVAIILIFRKVNPVYALFGGAIVDGGKAENIISPNPNTIAVAKGFNLDLAQVMINGFILAAVGLEETPLEFLKIYK